MTISYSLEDSLSKLFLETDNWGGRVLGSPYVTYEDHTVFSRFFEITLPYEGDCFIPVVGFARTLAFLSAEIVKTDNSKDPIKISYPLYIGSEQTSKTVDSIFKGFIRCDRSTRLINIKTSKGLDYYGGQGLIFDNSWNPIMMCGFNININRADKCIKFLKPVCFISPDVFTNNDLISKAIAKKIIYYLSVNKLCIPTALIHLRSIASANIADSTITFDNYAFDNALVVIKNLKEYFIKPTDVKLDSETLDTSIWEFLYNNIDELVE